MGYLEEEEKEEETQRPQGILIRERGRQENQRRRHEEGNRGWSDALAGFGGRGGGHKLRNACGF